MGRISIGGMVRDHNEDLIYGYSTPFVHGSNNQAKIEDAT